MRILLLVCALVPASCMVPTTPAGGLGPELAGLNRMVQQLETELDAREQRTISTVAQRGTALEASSRDHNMPTRFAIAPSSRILIEEPERHELTMMARDLSSLDSGRAAELVLDYGRTPSGLARAAKVMFLVKQETRAAILKHLRPIEIRTLLELRVINQPPDDDGLDRAAAPTGTSPKTRVEAPAATSSTSTPVIPAATAPGRRFQIAGYGEDAWKTVLDTFTGIVYDYRIVDQRATWVAITVKLVPEK